jgi:hypothetical protein
MSRPIEFRSHVPASQRRALEALVFFNTCQNRCADSIANAVEKFGSLEIVSEADRLRLAIAGLSEAQSLFAVEAGSGWPIGVAVYIRADVEHINVLHIGIASEYAAGGPREQEHLLLRLMRELRRSTRRLKGIQRIELYYVKERTASARQAARKLAL